jgi:ferredoxin
MDHVGRGCAAPREICMTFNNTAGSLIRHGHAREVDVAECLDLLAEACAHNLVQFGENVRQSVNFICNCCGCCCEAMIAARRFAILNPVHTSPFLPEVDLDACNGCGRCAERCPVAAMGLVSANDPHKPKRKKAHLNTDLCLGCGVCVRGCREGAIRLTPRPSRLIPPIDGVHRAVVMAIERGNLQDLIFDNRVLWSHRALAAVLGAVLKLPPLKQAMASRLIKSRALEALINHCDRA